MIAVWSLPILIDIKVPIKQATHISDADNEEIEYSNNTYYGAENELEFFNSFDVINQRWEPKKILKISVRPK